MFEKEIIFEGQLAARCSSSVARPENCHPTPVRWMCKRSREKVSELKPANWSTCPTLTPHARTDFFATHRGRADEGWNVHYNASGAFHDDLVRTPKGWRIQFRRLEVYFGDPLEIAKTA
jgi:hypothetical protein